MFINSVCSRGLTGNRTRNHWHTRNHWLNWASQQQGTSFDNILPLKIPRFLNLLGSCPIQTCSLEIRSPGMDPSRSHIKPLNWTQAGESKKVILGFLMHRASKITGVIPITLPVRSTEPINNHHAFKMAIDCAYRQRHGISSLDKQYSLFSFSRKP